MKKNFLALILCGLLIIATPGETLAAPTQQGFSDIQGHWAEQVILDISAQGLMQGIGTDEQGLRIFAPDMPVTCAQTAAVLVSLFKLDYGSKVFIKQPLASSYYSDVEDQSWYASAVLMCALNEIFPIGDSFYPDQSISRLEMAQAVKNSFNAKGISIPMIMSMPVFNDIEGLSSSDVNAIAFVNNTGIMKGENQLFRPSELMSRAELAQILKNCLQVLQRQGNVKQIDESYNGKEVSISPDQTITLSLASNASTGYQWTLTETYDQNLVKLGATSYQEPLQTTPALVGQGGRTYWQFTGLKAGTTQIKLIYARPWESVQPAQTFTVKITVASAPVPEQNPTFTIRTIKSETTNMIVDMEVPVIAGLGDAAVQSAINSQWEKDADAFVQEVKSGLDEYVQSSKDNGAPGNPFGAYSQYTIGNHENGFLSMYIDYYQYTGGAHGITNRKAYNIDLKTGKTLALSALFQDGFDYPATVNQAIHKQIDTAPDNYFSGESGFNGITADQDYYIQNDNLVVYFQEYQIAPYAAGFPEFKIPLNQLRDGMVINI
ncbi:MAG TPA: protease inhibitor I42 family protein [Syntrophomonadaceae bacterium]|nr:protease inhibitor I42 family protein [Syntrophomonadaceae bacterium]